MDPLYKKSYNKLKKRCLKHFPRYNEIDRFLRLISALHPKHVRLQVLGYSIQGRPIKMVILQGNKRCPKNAVMIECGIHAREWLSHTTALYVIDHVLKTKTMLRYMDFYIIPCVNPDGYEFTHHSFRLWRKNLNRNNSADLCNWGVDLNRNFPVAFGKQGASHVVTSNKYHGRKALSEPESMCLAKALHLYAKHIKLYISIHCFGHLIMYPWAYTTMPCSDQNELHRCAARAQKAIKRKFPKSKFRVGQLSKTMYISSGTTTDFVRGFYNIKFAFTMELHKEGCNGFIAKPCRILPVARETYCGIESMIKYVRKYYFIHSETN